MPDAIPAESFHQWRAFTVYKLTEELAYKLVHGPGAGDRPLVPVHPDEVSKVGPEVGLLTVDMIDADLMHVGCFTCEVQYSEAAGLPCPGEPVAHHKGRDGTVEPVYEVRSADTGEVRRGSWLRWVEMHGGKP